jgi:high potential iron-sulfur protein
MSVTRRLFLRGSAAIVGAAGLAAVTLRQAAAKIAPNLVGYQDKPNGEKTCANCKLFEAPNACKSVDGAISPQGWCKMWIKA